MWFNCIHQYVTLYFTSFGVILFFVLRINRFHCIEWFLLFLPIWRAVHGAVHDLAAERYADGFKWCKYLNYVLIFLHTVNSPNNTQIHGKVIVSNLCETQLTHLMQKNNIDIFPFFIESNNKTAIIYATWYNVAQFSTDRRSSYLICEIGLAMQMKQWPIQARFSRLLDQNFPKTTWNFKKRGRGEGGRPIRFPNQSCSELKWLKSSVCFAEH